jgi:hypothetical protein
MGEHAGLLALLIGRALRVAALALQQLYEAPIGSAQQQAFGEEFQKQGLSTQMEAMSLLSTLYLYNAALGPVLEQQATGARSIAAGSGTAARRPTYGSSATKLQGIAALQQLQLQLLRNTWVGMAEVMTKAGGMGGERLMQPMGGSVIKGAIVRVFPGDAAQQMLQLANGVCAQFVSAEVASLCCANPGCTNCSRLSEQELVSGKSTVCSGCRMVRLCSAECNTAFWKAGHKQICKQLRGSKQQTHAAGDTKGSSSGNCTGGTSRSRQSNSSSSSSNSSSRCSSGTVSGMANSSSSRSSSSTGCSQGSSTRSSSSGDFDGGPMGAGGSSSGAAVLELPGNAAAAAALSVRQLKALLTGLGAGCGKAVEKSDLVGALVAHLGLR